MELVHVIGGIDAVGGGKAAEELGGKLQIDNVYALHAVKAEFAAGQTHHKGIPFLVVPMAQHRRFKILGEGTVGLGAVGVTAVVQKILLCHLVLLSMQIAVNG